MSLPKEINYTEQMNSLPANTQSKSIVISPANLTTLLATKGGTAQFNLQNTGMIVPSSMYLRGKVNTTGATANTAKMFQRGIPAYSLWSKSAVIVGSQVVEQINGYGRLASALVDLKLNPAQKSGLSVGFGLSNEDDQYLTDHLNGRESNSNSADEWSFASPLPNLLSLSEKLLPASHMPSIRIELTMDNIANMFSVSGSTNVVDEVTISNLELVYTEVQFGLGLLTQ
jgi:hypothetical protein